MVRHFLRRHFDNPRAGHYCEARFPIGDHPEDRESSGAHRYVEPPPLTDERWPTKCDKCGVEFEPSAHAHVLTTELYRRHDTGQLLTLNEAPPGAMWYGHYYDYRGPRAENGEDVKRDTLIVRCPDGWDWTIDGRASNCTMVNDQAHRCWVRHGDPSRGELVTVDKNGLTCGAGAGSIMTLDQKYHGFLVNSEFKP